MFRELTRKKQQLSREECVEVLKNETRGVLSVSGMDGYPYGMPMNHYYNEADGAIYFHCSKVGHRLEALRRDNRASFCVYDGGYRKAGEWALNVRSVIAFGRVEILNDPARIVEISAALSHKFTSDEEYIQREIERFGKATLLLRLLPEHLCGKLVNES